MSESRAETTLDLGFGPYRLERVIAAGQSSVVFLANNRDARAARPFAIKVLAPRMPHDEGARRSFVRLGEAAAAFDHPVLCRTREAGTLHGLAYVVMELIDGWDLATVARRCRERGERMGARLVASLGVQVADALATIHDAADAVAAPGGLTHGRVGPWHVLLTRGGHLKLCGFERPFQEGGRFMVPGYLEQYSFLAPEQVDQDPFDRRADVYSLGLTLWSLATGSNPFLREGATQTFQAILSGGLPLNPRDDLPDRLEFVLRRCMARSPDERYRDCRVVARELGRAMGAMGGPMQPAEWREFAEHVFANHDGPAWEGQPIRNPDAAALVVRSIEDLQNAGVAAVVAPPRSAPPAEGPRLEVISGGAPSTGAPPPPLYVMPDDEPPPEAAPVLRAPPPPPARRERPTSPMAWVALAALATWVVIIGLWMLRERTDPEPEVVAVRPAPAPPSPAVEPPLPAEEVVLPEPVETPAEQPISADAVPTAGSASGGTDERTTRTAEAAERAAEAAARAAEAAARAAEATARPAAQAAPQAATTAKARKSEPPPAETRGSEPVVAPPAAAAKDAAPASGAVVATPPAGPSSPPEPEMADPQASLDNVLVSVGPDHVVITGLLVGARIQPMHHQVDGADPRNPTRYVVKLPATKSDLGFTALPVASNLVSSVTFRQTSHELVVTVHSPATTPPAIEFTSARDRFTVTVRLAEGGG